MQIVGDSTEVGAYINTYVTLTSITMHVYHKN